jgi:hypothetical protein
MTPLSAWIATGWGEVAVALMLACLALWALMAKKARTR